MIRQLNVRNYTVARDKKKKIPLTCSLDTSSPEEYTQFICPPITGSISTLSYIIGNGRLLSPTIYTTKAAFSNTVRIFANIITKTVPNIRVLLSTKKTATPQVKYEESPAKTF